MFSKTNKDTKPQQTEAAANPPKKPAAPSIISVDLRMVGDLSSDGEIQIDGTVDGDIRTKSLLVGETAKITGEIIADEIKVHGNVNGQIKARCVRLAKTAHVTGDILHEDLSIDTGAFLEGHCKRVEFKTEGGKLNLIAKDTPKPNNPAEVSGGGPNGSSGGPSGGPSGGSRGDVSKATA